MEALELVAEHLNVEPDHYDLSKRYIDGYSCIFNQTCGACPEQYDVYIVENDQVMQLGYLRLRHGRFRADYGYCGGKTVFEAEPHGDAIFEYGERETYLCKAAKELVAYHKAQ